MCENYRRVRNKRKIEISEIANENIKRNEDVHVFSGESVLMISVNT